MIRQWAIVYLNYLARICHYCVYLPIREFPRLAIAITLFVTPLKIATAEETLDVPVHWSSVQLAGVFDGSPFSITMESRSGSAISSLRWRDKEFINSFDHGRELQSAVSFNGWGECFNPTEAGSARDGTGDTTTSVLNRLNVTGKFVISASRMAFWLAPGTTSPGCPPGILAINPASVSDVVLAKTVRIAAAGVPNAIDHSVTFRVPRAYKSAVFAALTAYMPPEFNRFWTFDPASAMLTPLSAGPGEQGLPVILSTSDGNYAFGVYSADLPQKKWPRVGYGRWDFTYMKAPGSATVKWNCVFRESDLIAGDYKYKCTSVFGTLSDVEAGIAALYRKRLPVAEMRGGAD
jgi:hypothetical protein